MSNEKNVKVDFIVLKRLEAYSGPEDNLIDELIRDYESDSKKLLSSLTEQLSRNDANGIQESAHGLRSISGCLGMVIVSDICQRLENAIHMDATTAEDIKALSTEVTTALMLVKSYQSSKA